MSDIFEYVPLDKIKVKKHSVRLHGIEQGIEDPAEITKTNGLLQPIAAYYDSAKSTCL